MKIIRVEYIGMNGRSSVEILQGTIESVSAPRGPEGGELIHESYIDLQIRPDKADETERFSYNSNDLEKLEILLGAGSPADLKGRKVSLVYQGYLKGLGLTRN